MASRSARKPAECSSGRGVKYPDRQSAPGSEERNAWVISSSIQTLLSGVGSGGRILELAAGHGALIERLCVNHPKLSFWAAEADETLVKDIRKRCAHLNNFRGTAVLDFNSPIERSAWEWFADAERPREESRKRSQGDHTEVAGSTNPSNVDLAFVVNVVHIVP